MRRTVLKLVILTTLSLVVIACGGAEDASTAPGEGPIKIGAIFDLSGPTSDVGTIYAAGIRGYFEWLDEAGGIDGREVDLLYQDYAYKVDQAEQLYSQFVQEGAVVFLGWGTGDTEALRGRIAEDEIPFTSASYSHVLGNPAQAPYNFLVGTSYSDQLAIVLDWIVESEAAAAPTAIAMMHHPSPFGRSPFEQGGRDYAASLGIELSAHEMPRGSTDYTAELTRIHQSGVRHVVFQTTSGPVAVALKNARDLGLDMSFYCLNWCSNELLVELSGNAAEGVVGSITFSPPSEEVMGLTEAAAFLEAKGSSIAKEGLVYGQGWTTAAVMMEGVRRVLAEGGEVTGKSVKEALETLTSFDTGGVTVPITYSSEGHLGARGMRLFVVEQGEWRQLTDFRNAPSWEE
jgi:branched-chain amino acid transport system substrate-binding protein